MQIQIEPFGQSSPLTCNSLRKYFYSLLNLTTVNSARTIASQNRLRMLFNNIFRYESRSWPRQLCDSLATQETQIPQMVRIFCSSVIKHPFDVVRRSPEGQNPFVGVVVFAGVNVANMI